MSDQAQVPKLVPTLPEAEIAADLKKRAEEAFKPLLDILDEGATRGLHISWDSIIPGARLTHVVNGLRVTKTY